MGPAFTLHPPLAQALPLVCDSPHSGTDYPADFGHSVPLNLLRQGEDTHVDTLWAAVPHVGGTLLAAHFPRTYIDPNRTLDDLDPALLAQPWPQPLTPGAKSSLGYGLVWRQISEGIPIYDRLLSVDEVSQRINRCYLPYHAALAQAIESAAQCHGGVWHLNLHSMPADAYQRLKINSPHPLADFVLGDRDGSTCEPGFIAVVEHALLERGYTVARNDPYKGVQLIAHIGQPGLNRHSLQVEIRRPLYMDEATRVPHAGFERLRSDLTEVLHDVARYVRAKLNTSWQGRTNPNR